MKDFAEMVGTDAPGLALELEPELDVPLLLHAAARRPSVQTPDVTANFLAIRLN